MAACNTAARTCSYCIPSTPGFVQDEKEVMQLAIAEAKRAGDRGDYPIRAVITQLIGAREVVIASAGNRVITSGSSALSNWERNP